MKAIFTLLLATFFTTAFAANEGKLTISIASGKNVSVYVDGRLQRVYDNEITVNSIRPGNHSIQVYRNTNSNTNVNNRRNQNADRRGQLLHTSNVYVRPSYHVDVVINRFGKAMVDERSLSGANNGWGDDWDSDWNRGYSGYNQAIADHEFNLLMQRIRSTWFGRLASTKDAINENYFTTMQLRQIVQVFTAESEKLELAKLAYSKLIDRNNFRQIYDLFSYASQSALDRFVKDYRG